MKNKITAVISALNEEMTIEKVLKDTKKYIIKVDEVFALIKEAIVKNKVKELLEGPVAHDIFTRLT